MLLAHFKEITDCLPEACFIVDEGGEVLTANQSCQELFGFPHREMPGKSLYELACSDSVQISRYLKTCRRNKQPMPGSLCWLNEKGEKITSRCWGNVVRSGSGKQNSMILLRCMVSEPRGDKFIKLNTALELLNASHHKLKAKSQALQQEIIEHTKVEAELRSTKEYIEQLVETANVLFLVHDPSGLVQRLNNATVEVTGYKREELLGKNWFELVVPETYRDTVRTMFADNFDFEQPVPPYSFEYPIITKNDDQRLISWQNSSLCEQDGPRSIISFGIDITERKQAEDAVLEGERQLFTLLSNLPGMAYKSINDTNRTMEFVSDGSLELTGFLPHTLTGYRSLSFRGLILPADRNRVLGEIQTALENKQPFITTYRIRTSSDEVKWVHEQGVGVYNEEGEVEAIEGFLTDITKSKRLADEREKLISNLQEALGKIKTLSGFLPICASCKKIRDDKGYWNQIEAYIRDHSDAEFSHGICPDCADKLYPELSLNDKNSSN